MTNKIQREIVRLVIGPVRAEIPSLLKFPVPNSLLSKYCNDKLRKVIPSEYPQYVRLRIRPLGLNKIRNGVIGPILFHNPKAKLRLWKPSSTRLSA